MTDGETVGFEADREVRIGLVMYGGVSLAVYINGVAQEMLALVRATAPAVDAATGEVSDRLHVADEDLTPVERVYREVGQILGEPGVDVHTAPVRTRIVVDIIAGSSAGGINGVYLAKALANQQDIEALKTLWVNQAGVTDILNDVQGRRPRPGSTVVIPAEEVVESLFSGDVMYAQLLDALEHMDAATPAEPVPGATGAAASALVRDLDLWITATDLAGVALPLRLDDEQIFESQHRHTFHFVFGEAQIDSGRINDFTRESNPILAFAARATSSFPFAFAPARLVDIGRLTGADGKPLDPADQRWRRWFARYLSFADSGYQEVAFGDGGDIDNKPFSWVTDTLSARTSISPVDRRIFYVEPDPGDPTPATRAAPKPDVVGSTVAAISLGRVENIRDDLDRLERRASSAARIKTSIDAVQRLYARRHTSEALATSTDDWLTEAPAAMVARGLPYAAYYGLRVESLITEFGRSIAKVPWHAADTPSSLAARVLVQSWVSSAYGDPYEVPDTDQTPTTKRFLRDFDIAFRIRRLAFVSARADLLATELPGPLTPANLDRFRVELRRIKKELGRAEEGLRLAVPALRSARDIVPSTHTYGSATEFALEPDEVAVLLATPPGALRPPRQEEFLAFCAGVSDYLAQSVFPAASDTVRAAFAPTAGETTSPEAQARRLVGDYFQRYADFDQVTFPALTVAGITGEVDDVKVHRISPRDTSNLDKPAVGADAQGTGGSGGWRGKVAGARFGHFGGFLDAEWRANDIMWGRLDAAERLLRTLLGDDARAQGLIDRAQDAILLEEWFGDGGRGAPGPLEGGTAERLAAFRQGYELPPWPAAEDLLALGARSMKVGNELTGRLGHRPGATILHRATGVASWSLSVVAAWWFPARLRRAILDRLRRSHHPAT